MQSGTSELGIEYFDDLTGLYNRRYLTKKLFQYIQKANRDKTPMSLVIIDLDHFKNINDTYGHSTGDTVLKAVAAFLKEMLRKDDTVFRYGGDEFICILPDTEYKHAERISSRFLEQCRSREFAKIRLTYSIGIASYPSDGKDWLTMFNTADNRLYSAKRNGRDRIGALSKEHRRIITPTRELIGRDDFVAQIKSVVTLQAKDNIRAVNVSGEIGVGKSRLVHEIASDPDYEDVVYLESVLSPTTRSIPYYPFREIIRSVIRKKGKKSLINIPTAFQIELLKILPELAEEMEKPDKNSVFMIDKFRLFEGVCRFLIAQASDSPLFLCLDNIHWADENSLELFSYLIRTLSGNPVFFFFIYRIEEAQSDSFQNVLQSLNRENLFDGIELEPLGQADTARMLSLILDASPSPELIAFIYRETGGNPLFIEELMKSLELNNSLTWKDENASYDMNEKITIPNSVKGVVDRKMGMMGHRACELLEYASVIGREFDFKLLPLMTGRNEGHLLDLLDKILGVRLLKECEGDRYRFTEDVVRETIYQRMSTARLKLYHQTVGNALEILHENCTEKVIEELTHHFYMCSDHEKVVEYGMIAADKAKDAYANRDAINFYGKILECLPEDNTNSRITEIKVLMKRASVLDLVGDSEKAMEDLKCAVSNSRSLGEKKLEADSLILLCKAHFGISNYAITIEMAGIALEICRSLDDKEGEATCLNCIGIANWYLGKYKTALKLYQKSLKIAKSTGDQQTEAKTLSNISIIHWSLDDYTRALDIYLRALKLMQTVGDTISEAKALNNIGLIHSSSGDNKESMEYYEKSLEISRNMCARQLEASVLNNMGIIYVRFGEYSKAIGNYKDSLNISEDTGTRRVEAMACNNIGTLYRDLGNYDTALEYCTRSLRISKDISDRQTETESLVALGDLFLSKGNLPDAEEYYEKALSIAQSINSKSLLAEILISSTSLHLDRNNPAKTAKTLKHVFQLVDELDSDTVEASAYLLSGRLAAQENRWNDATTAFDKSLLVHRKFDRQLSTGEVYYYQGLMFNKAGDGARALESFTRATDIFKRIGATGWLDKLNAAMKPVKQA
ncbi:MAG: tetratricopeptide repeat protein [Candidatus Sabulitectum sp.]|nr:tetratricopeptide repeat protein [Candidatus Sabulitectum sp.]